MPRELAEASLFEFVKQAWPQIEGDRQFVDNWHIQGICTELEAVARKETRNLLINVPPGCMKSLLCCVFFPAWVWIANPAARFLFASYGQELSTRDSVSTRQLVESDWYRANWGDRVRLRIDQNQKTRFDTTAGGWRIATSVGGRGTGEHPDYIGIDDPHNVKEAESDVERRGVADWYDGTIALRGVSRGVCRVVVMQRLHEADLSGHILGKGIDLVHVCLPMRYEPDRMPTTPAGFNDPRGVSGELLWPALFPMDVVEREEKDLASQYKIAGQMQQRPVPKEGGKFKRDWFKIIERYPEDARTAVRYWDWATTEDGGDYTVGLLLVKHELRMYVADIVRGQWSAAERTKQIKHCCERDERRFHHFTTWMEKPSGAAEELVKATIRECQGHVIKGDPITGKSGGKEMRAEPAAAAAQNGDIFLVRALWNAPFLDELCVFPNGRHDDQVDALSGAFNRLSNRKQFLASIA